MFATEQTWNQYNLGEFTIKLEYFPKCFFSGEGGKRWIREEGGKQFKQL